MEEWVHSLWIVAWQKIIPSACLMDCIGMEVCVYCMHLCGFFRSVFLCIGQIDTVKATYKTVNEEQDVAEGCSTHCVSFKMVPIVMTVKMVNLKYDYHYYSYSVAL